MGGAPSAVQAVEGTCGEGQEPREVAGEARSAILGATTEAQPCSVPPEAAAAPAADDVDEGDARSAGEDGEAAAAAEEDEGAAHGQGEDDVLAVPASGDAAEPAASEEPSGVEAPVTLESLIQRVPLNDADVELAAQLIAKAGIDELRRLNLAPPPKRPPPKRETLELMDIHQRMETIQAFISSFQYNHTGNNYFDVRKNRPLTRIMDTARDICRDALPIKCVEGVFLALLLTSGLEDTDRYPVGFKSAVGGRVYRHIVLAVHHRPSGKFGALGLSRRESLMYKPPEFASLSDLMADFKRAYERWWHVVLKIRVGLPVDHNLYHAGPVCWRYCHCNLEKVLWEEAAEHIDKHVASAKRRLGTWRLRLERANALGQRKTASKWDGYASEDSETGAPVPADSFGARRRPTKTSGSSSKAQGAKRRAEKSSAAATAAPDARENNEAGECTNREPGDGDGTEVDGESSSQQRGSGGGSGGDGGDGSSEDDDGSSSEDENAADLPGDEGDEAQQAAGAQAAATAAALHSSAGCVLGAEGPSTGPSATG
ncbi:unnamed protein product [Pedinophyceae sp. YPF-701]|nr:unnamed protein product [Pedinophyceae sp. YPF-701]